MKGAVHIVLQRFLHGSAVYICIGLRLSEDVSYFLFRGVFMQTRVAVMGIVVENTDSVERLNTLLHEYGSYIIGRMGIPYRARNINIVSIAIDAPQDVISALSGKIGNLDGISVKTAYSNVQSDE